MRVGRDEREVSKLFAPASTSHVSPSLAAAPPRTTPDSTPSVHTHARSTPHCTHRTARATLHSPRPHAQAQHHGDSPRLHDALHTRVRPQLTLAARSQCPFILCFIFSFLFSLFHFSFVTHHSPLITRHPSPITHPSSLPIPHPIFHLISHGRTSCLCPRTLDSYDVLPQHTIQYNTIQYNTTQHNTTQRNHNTAQQTRRRSVSHGTSPARTTCTARASSS